MSVVPITTARTATGRFAPGRSGNPAGRPKGARNRATLAAEALFADNAEALARKLVDSGLGGDGQAMRFLIARLLPPAKDRPITLDVAPGKEGDLVHLHGLVIRAMADGEITPHEALAAARVIAIGVRLAQLRMRARSPRASAPDNAQERAAPVSPLYFSRARLPVPPAREEEGKRGAAGCRDAIGFSHRDLAGPGGI
jgi:hypothetical protein